MLLVLKRGEWEGGNPPPQHLIPRTRCLHTTMRRWKLAKEDYKYHREKKIIVIRAITHTHPPPKIHLVFPSWKFSHVILSSGFQDFLSFRDCKRKLSVEAMIGGREEGKGVFRGGGGVKGEFLV